MLPGLDYTAVLPAGRKRAALIDRTTSGGDPAALRLWQIPAQAQAPDERLPRAQALAASAAACAAEIARLLARPNGERRLTNLLHLAELLQQDAGSVAPETLLRLLASRRAESGGGEAAQLRLESDRNLVQIVTIHRAKGLEYGIVFCPFLFDGYARRDDGGLMRAWHD